MMSPVQRVRTLGKGRPDRLFSYEPPSPGWAPAGRAARLYGWIEANLRYELEQRAGFFWLPVFAAAGVALYATLPREPSLLVLVGMAVALVALLHTRTSYVGIAATAVALCVVGGMAGMKLRVETVGAAPVSRGGVATIDAVVHTAEARAEGRQRLVLDLLDADVDWLAADARVRISAAARGDLPAPGDRVTLLARLDRVPGASVPGGYDAAFRAFFEGIAASGFALGDVTILERSARRTLTARIARLRKAIGQRVVEAVEGETGAFAKALIVGDRSDLSRETVDALRASGLAHVLAISGLHMTLFAGTAFFAVRLLLAHFEHAALRWPIKKIAALCALLVAGFYLTISGVSTPTQRAFVMAAIGLSAILVDRSAVSMRNLALAAFVVIAIAPESVLAPGFQMSFLVVMALVAVYEAIARARRDRNDLADEEASLLWRTVAVPLGAIALTTTVAGLVTSPIAAHHFQVLTPYSLLANLAAMPLVSLWIMPLALVSLLAMPFGIEVVPLTLMAGGLSIVLEVARMVASMDGAVIHVMKPPLASTLLIVAGIMWLSLWRRAWRLYGAALCIVGLGVAAWPQPRPDVFVAAEANQMGLRSGGVLTVSGTRPGSFVAEQWARAGGLDPANVAAAETCDRYGCILRNDVAALAHIRHPAAAEEDCRRADIAILAARVSASCVTDGEELAGRASPVIDPDEPALIYLDRTETGEVTFKIRQRLRNGHRPWHPPSDQ